MFGEVLGWMSWSLSFFFFLRGAVFERNGPNCQGQVTDGEPLQQGSSLQRILGSLFVTPANRPLAMQQGPASTSKTETLKIMVGPSLVGMDTS